MAALTPRSGLLVVVAWLPFFILWTVMNVATFSASLREATIGATSAIGSAAILGVGAWWITGRFEWPERFSAAFYAMHLLAGSVYSAVWIGFGATMSLVLWNHPVKVTILGSGWRFVMGLWLYGFVAGVSYVIRFRARLAEQRELALRAEALAANARLGQLRSQLNPHFLFNALHTVSYLIGHDAERAKEAVERLGGMLRYAIEQGDELATLDREWAFAQDYLAIERMRLEERLVVESEVDDRLLEERVPIFSLQTLVENAVRHSVARSSRPTRVTISVRDEAGAITLEVTDDGPGADVATIENAGGLGLRNLQGRLASHFGTAAALRIETCPGMGFQATVTIPRNPHTRPSGPPTPIAPAEEIVA